MDQRALVLGHHQETASVTQKKTQMPHCARPCDGVILMDSPAMSCNEGRYFKKRSFDRE